MKRAKFRTYLLFFLTIFYIFFILPFLFVFPSLYNFMTGFEIVKAVFFVLFLLGILSLVFAIILWLLFSKIIEKIVFGGSIVLLFYIISLILSNWIRGTFSLPNLLIIILSVFFTLILLALLLFFIWKRRKGLIYSFNEIIEPINFVFLGIFVVSIAFLLFNSGKLFKKSLHQETQDNYPNIIIVLFDALSAYHLPIYGYNEIQTPNIDRFANESIVFSPMVAPSNCTALSIPSIMTGKTPYRHKIADFEEYFPSEMRNENILRILKENGYYCYSIVQNPLTALSAFGLQTWIDREPYPVFIPNVSYRLLSFILHLSKISNKMNIPSYPVMKKWVSAAFRARPGGRFELPFSREILYNPFLPSIPFDHAMQLIDKGEHPFFLFIHVFPPHDPFLPPDVNIPEQFNSVQKQIKYLHGPHSEEELENINMLKELYDKNIEHIDKELGKFIHKLKDADIFDNSLIILTSDHGETFIPEWVGHNSVSYAYEPMIRVPFIMKMPYSILHQDIDVISSGLDIAPSILDVLNIDIPVWMEGETLVPFINGEKLKRDFPCICMRIAKRKKKFIDNGFITLVGERKLIYHIKQKEIRLTDPVSDPYDKKDISEVFPDEKEKLRKYLFEYLGISEIPQKLSYPNN